MAGAVLGVVVDEEADEGVVAALGGFKESVVAQIVLHIGVSARPQQRVHSRSVVANHRQHQRRAVVIVPLVHVKAVLDHLCACRSQTLSAASHQHRTLKTTVLHEAERCRSGTAAMISHIVRQFVADQSARPF